MLHALNPSVCPGFSASWLQLVFHRFFMPRLLQTERHVRWPIFKRLLVDLLEFLSPYLSIVPLSNTIRIFYKAALRTMLILLHDFPEFLCDYHFDLVNAIPYTCIQLRNLILSAFPQDMKLPDPFTPNLRVELLPEINQTPTILSDYTNSLVNLDLITPIDTYLETKGPHSFLAELTSKLLLVDSSNTDTKYDSKVINSLVFYVGIKTISQSKEKISVIEGISNTPALDIFQVLSNEMDSEGKKHERFKNRTLLSL